MAESKESSTGFTTYVRYFPNAITTSSIQPFTSVVYSFFPPQRSKCVVFGRAYDVPRDQFVVFFDTQDTFDYSYSNHSVPVRATFPELERIRGEVEVLTGAKYNFVLINRYRDGKDGVGWHADDEPLVDQTQPIASVSVGGTRKFDLRMAHNHSVKTRFMLSEGDLAVMLPGCQDHCQHQVPKQAEAQPRINLTFRVLKNSPQAARSRKRKRKHE